MLEALRRGAQSWLAKILFAVLIVSFGVFWNIDGVFTGGGRNSLAKVGDADVTLTEFQRALQNELQGLSQQTGKRITAAEARNFGIDTIVLKRLINDAAMADHTKTLGLGISDEVLADNLKQDENLQGPDGKFSRQVLNEIMQQMGVNEAGLLQLLRKDELRRQIVSALSNAIVVPAPLIEVQHQYSGETRKIEHFAIDPMIVKVGEPDEAALKSTYESNLRRFVVPEYRKIAALVLTVTDLKKEMTITDDEIKQAYESSKQTYDIPEKRRVQQIAFKDRAAADEAKKALDGGKSFRDVAQDAGATEADINLGLVTKKQLIDKTIAEAAFSLERDKISDVIDGRFRPVIIRVVEIQPGKESTLDEVRGKIEDKLSREKAAPEVQARFDLVEEQRNLGKSLKEIADTLKLKYIEAEAADRSNKRPDGSRAIDHIDDRAIVDAAFSAEQGVERDAIELKQAEGYAWVDVLSVTPEKQKTFEEVKADVKPVFEETERKRLVDEFANKLIERADQGEEFAKLATEAGGKVEVTPEPIARTTITSGLDEHAVQRAFTLAKGKSGSSRTLDGKSRVVFRVMDIIPAPAASKEDAETLAANLKGDLQEDQIGAYVAALTSKLGVSINEAELKRATGASDQ